MKTWTAFFVAAMFMAVPASAAELLMFRSDSCSWCEIWEEQIGILYNKTDEAETVPLRRVDVDIDLPSDLKKYDAVFFTPTFIVQENGMEIGRIIGYPGEEFFFPMLDQLINKLNSANKSKSASAL